MELPTLPPPPKGKIMATIFVVVLLTSAITGYYSYTATSTAIEHCKDRELQIASTLIQNDLIEQANKALARATMVARMPIVINSMREQNRKPIVDALVPMFLLLREKYGVREGQFHVPPATSFLRIYDVEAGHGEDLSSFREMVLMANKELKPFSGVEIGRRGLSIRGIDVIRDDNGHYGSIEIGMDFSSILNNVKKNLGFEAGVFVDDQKMTSVATLLPKAEAERVIGGFCNTEATDWNFIRTVVTPDFLRQVNDVTARSQSIGGVDYGFVAIPLLDFKGTPIGSVVAARNFMEFANALNGALVKAIFLAFLQGLLLIFVILVLINSYFVLPLAEGKKE
ncbi:MAG: hypothetical protein HQM09_18045 [Candidatus Riflebacteria bacterium]|nr:hypothetical protein [Candidatus Riflebacteria bacterium]